MALKHLKIQNINQKSQSTPYIFNIGILETKNRIWESDEKKCGMWNFHQKGAGMPDQDPRPF